MEQLIGKKTKKGMYNSSITRVRPLFKLLISKDPSGQTWMKALLKEARREKNYANGLLIKSFQIHGTLFHKREVRDKVLDNILLEKCFEYELAPPIRFLEWLIKNPDEISWPDNGEKVFSDETQEKRENLIGRNGQTLQVKAIDEAINALSNDGADFSKRKWWAFEGFTELDCYLETDDFILGIEGKRNEPVSSAISWFPQRNQMIRNLEAIKQKAGMKDFALFLLSEDGIDPINNQIVEESLPHLSEEERIEIMGHYLGCLSWEEACLATDVDFKELPHDKYQAIKKGLI